MADIEKISVGGTSYDVRDALAAHALSDIAVAGDNVTFETPINIDYVASGNKVGSPSIVNGLFTTTSSSYLQINNASISNYSGSIFTGNYNWAWTVKFKTPASFTKAHRIFMFGSSVSSNPNMWAGISEDTSPAGSLALGVHNRDAWNSLYDADSPYILETDTWYWLRVSRDVSTNIYKAEVSTDGVSWSTAYSFVDSYALYDSNSTMFISQVSSSYDALEYDLTGVSFTSNYAGGINWVAYIHDGRTSINATGLLKNTATGSNSLTILGNAAGSQNSVNIGAGSRVSSSGSTAIGYNARTEYNNGVAVGYEAYASDNAVCIGYPTATVNGRKGACNTNTIAIGQATAANSEDIAIGVATAYGSSSIAIGRASATANYAIQLGRGSNSTASTFSVGLGVQASKNYRLLESDGTIPVARMPSGLPKKEVYTCPALTTDGTVCSWTVTHTLGTDELIAQVYYQYSKDSWKKVEADIEFLGNTSEFYIDLISDTDIPAGTYKVVIIG